MTAAQATHIHWRFRPLIFRLNLQIVSMSIQPSEIDGLDMEDYWFWIGVAEREVKRRNEMMQSLYGR